LNEGWDHPEQLKEKGEHLHDGILSPIPAVCSTEKDGFESKLQSLNVQVYNRGE
jgi:hypothetical protein